MLFFEKRMNDWLLVNNGMGVKPCLKSLPSHTSHIPSVVVNEPATNYDSIDDQLTCDCFFDAHDIGAPLKLNTHPVVDFLSFTSPAKSASV